MPDARTVEAIVATFNVRQRSGDVVLPGAIRDGRRVVLSAYGHDVITQGAAPVAQTWAIELSDVSRTLRTTPVLRGHDYFA